MRIARRSGKEAQVIDREHQVRPRLTNLYGLPVFSDSRRANSSACFSSRSASFQMRFRAFSRDQPRPAPIIEGCLGRLYGQVDILGAGIHHFGNFLAGGRVLDGHHTATLAVHPLPLIQSLCSIIFLLVIADQEFKRIATIWILVISSMAKRTPSRPRPLRRLPP